MPNALQKWAWPGPADVESFTKYVELVSKLMSVVALVVGAMWFWANYKLTRAGEWAIDVRVSHKVIKVEGDHCLVAINFSLKNVGKAAVYAKKVRGVVLTLYEFPGDPAAHGVIDWKKSRRLVLTYDVTAQYDGYFIEPGSEPHESEMLKLQRGKLYGVSVSFNADDEQIGDTKYIYIDVD